MIKPKIKKKGSKDLLSNEFLISEILIVIQIKSRKNRTIFQKSGLIELPCGAGL